MFRAREPTNRASFDTALLRLAAGLVAVSALLLVVGASHGAEATLRAVSAFPDGTAFSTNFERFIERVNERSQGLVYIDYRGGGGKLMNPFLIGDAVRTGVVDVANLPGAYYTRLMPEADAIKLSAFTIAEERRNDAGGAADPASLRRR